MGKPRLAKPEGEFVVQFVNVGRAKKTWTSTFYVVPDDRLLLDEAKRTGELRSKDLAVVWDVDKDGAPVGYICGLSPRILGGIRRISGWTD